MLIIFTVIYTSGMVLYSYGVMMKEMTTALDLSINQIITTSCEVQTIYRAIIKLNISIYLCEIYCTIFITHLFVGHISFQ